jgi:hypothetical protein
MKAIYDTTTAKLLPWPRIDEEPVVGLAPHLLEMTVTQEPQPAFDPATQRLEKTEVIDAEARTVTRGWNIIDIEAPTWTAESWLDHEGFGAMRLLGLLDLESQFGQQSPPKMQAVRAWINSIRAQYAETKSDWQPAPHTFESTMQEIEQWQTN